jgi:archaellum component FlaG (FlaF/FlaG flagellin family)
MGFSGLSSHVIMFIAVVSVATGLVAMFNSYIDTSSAAMVTQQQFLSNQIKTDITIENIVFYNGSYNSRWNITRIYVKNTGATTLDPDEVDVYINGYRFNRTPAILRKNVMVSDTDTINIGKWDPKEVLMIQANHSYIYNNRLFENRTYDVVITAQYGAKATDQFSTPTVIR